MATYPAAIGAGTLTSTASGPTNLVQSAYDRYVEFALRSQPLFRSVVDKRPVQQAMPGSSVVFNIYADLAAVSSTLAESTDPDANALSNTTNVSVTLNEYGNVVLETKRLAELAFTDIDPAIANIVAYNMADSLDALVMGVARAGTNVIYASGSATSGVLGTSGGQITNAHIRRAVAKLRAGNALPRLGSLYAGYIHPEVAHDLRAEAGSSSVSGLQGSFEDVRKYTSDNVGNILNGVIGVVNGAYFVETPRMYNSTDGASSARVFRTILCGQQAIAEAVAIEPHLVMGPIIDRLNRFRPVGWHGMLGWARFREASLYRIESTSSINNS
jgi:N4-gp56 family major capsid protein